MCSRDDWTLLCSALLYSTLLYSTLLCSTRLGSTPNKRWASGGDLRSLYQQKTFDFKTGLKIVLGVAKGLAHMHSMPEAVVHRDIKSMNILVMEDLITGKVADCGESRRLDLNSTMTQTGSPLWAAPELLAGKRYCEDVDTYSFGVVLYEIAVRQLPYWDEIQAYKAKGGKGMKAGLMRSISKGDTRPELDPLVCGTFRISGPFKKLFRHCVKFVPRQRPAIGDVVRRLEEIVLAAERKPLSTNHLPTVTSKVLKGQVFKPWADSSTVAAALESFASRVDDSQENRAKLKEVCKEVRLALGPHATDPAFGVYNAARLYRFLLASKMDVHDTTTLVILNWNARAEFKMDAKRKVIIEQDLGFATLPRAAEYVQFQPLNYRIGRLDDGRSFGYMSWGSSADFLGLAKAFSIKEYLKVHVYMQELDRLVLDAESAVEGRDIGHVSLFDVSGSLDQERARLHVSHLIVSPRIPFYPIQFRPIPFHPIQSNPTPTLAPPQTVQRGKF